MTPTIKIELTEADVRTAIAEYINNRPHWVNDQHVYDDNVKIEVGQTYEDRPGGGSTPQFKKAVITVKQKVETK